jgi:hypothetical protein
MKKKKEKIIQERIISIKNPKDAETKDGLFDLEKLSNHLVDSYLKGDFKVIKEKKKKKK